MEFSILLSLIRYAKACSGFVSGQSTNEQVWLHGLQLRTPWGDFGIFKKKP